MKMLVIGGTGHIGSYLVPRLTAAGHDVTVIARRSESQYTDMRLGWSNVTWIKADRTQEEADDTWAKRMASIDTDVVLDLICYQPEQAHVMYEAFRGRVKHFVHIGTVWSYGPPEQLPYEESFPRKPIGDYGRKKAQIESFLVEKYQQEGFPVSIIHPGHISGRRWLPIDPQGSRDGVGVYEKIARGEKVALPNDGLATIHHIHADDIGQLIQRCIERPNVSLGESFSAVTPYALTLVGCCNAVAALLGTKANLSFVPFAELAQHVGEQSAGIIGEHITHSPCCSIAKCRRLLDYQPRFTTQEIYAECLDYLLDSGQLVL